MYGKTFIFDIGAVDTLSIIAWETLCLVTHFSSNLLNKDFAKSCITSRYGGIAAFWALAKFWRVIITYIVFAQGNSLKAWPSIQNRLKSARFFH